LAEHARAFAERLYTATKGPAEPGQKSSKRSRADGARSRAAGSPRWPIAASPTVAEQPWARTGTSVWGFMGRHISRFGRAALSWRMVIHEFDP